MDINELDIIRAMEEPDLFGHYFQRIDGADTYHNWKVILRAIFSVPWPDDYPLDRKFDDIDLFESCTGRSRWPENPINEAYILIGIRSGKTDMIALIGAFLATCRRYPVGKERKWVIIVSPTEKQSRETFDRIYKMISGSPLLNDQIEGSTKEEIRLCGNRGIVILSSNYKSLRGYTAMASVVDEACFLSSEGAKPDTEVYTALYGRMATTGGPLISVSTPFTKTGVVWDAYNEHFGKVDSPVLVVQTDSKTMNPTLTDETMKRLRRKFGDVVALTEIEAQWRQDISNFLDPDRVKACIAPWAEQPYDPAYTHLAFTDPSGGGSDSYTCAIGRYNRGRVEIVATREIQPPFNPNNAVAELAQFARSYGLSKVFGDAYAGEFNISLWTEQGFEYEKAVKRTLLYLELEKGINCEEVVLPKSEKLYRQLIQLERRTTRSKMDLIDHPKGSMYHDDVANCVAGVYYYMMQDKPVFVRVREYDWETGRVIAYSYSNDHYGRWCLEVDLDNSWLFLSPLMNPIDDAVYYKSTAEFELWLKQRYAASVVDRTRTMPKPEGL